MIETLMCVSIATLAIGLVFKQPVMCYIAGLFWLFFGIYAFDLSGKDSTHIDIYMGMYMLSIIMIIASFALGVAVKYKEKTAEEELQRKELELLEKAQRLGPSVIRQLRQGRRDRRIEREDRKRY